MRNLKRALSLVLAVVMVIGLMVVGASAVSYNDFSDREEIVNKDAVSMLTTLGVIEGLPDGSYDPAGNVDRAQMAKMISVIMNQGADNSALYVSTVTNLTDVDTNWASGHIKYCYTNGIIAGRGDNTFDPDANVTAVEAAKMLLVAAGYDPTIEGLEGTDWALNTNALASRLGIFRNFTKDVTQPLNRDDAALLIYNALDVEMIQQYQNGYALSYADHRTILSAMYGVYKMEGVVVANEWAALDRAGSETALREGRTTLDDIVLYGSTTANTTTGEDERLSAPETFQVSTTEDMLGKTVTFYIEKTTILSNSTVIGYAINDDDNVVLTSEANEDSSRDFLRGTGITVNDDTEYYVNYGYQANQAAAIETINENPNYDLESADTARFNLNGIQMEVIDNNDDGVAEYVLYKMETLSEVRSYSSRNETISLYEPGRTTAGVLDGSADSFSRDLEDVVFVDDASVETDDLVLYVEYGGRTYISLPEIVTGQMSRVDRDRNNELYITVEGAEYRQSFIPDAASKMDVELTHFDISVLPDDDMVPFSTDYNFILDSTGEYVVAVRPAEDTTPNYALVLDSAWTQNALTKGGEVKILMADGTEGTYTINWSASRRAAFDGSDTALEDYLGTRDVQNSSGYLTGAAVATVITYTLDDDNELTITSVLKQSVLNADGKVAETGTNGLADDENGINAIDEYARIDTITDRNNNVVADENLQWVLDADYENGDAYVSLRVDTTESANYGVNPNPNELTYAIDRNTIAFYYLSEDNYGVSIGWDNMGDVDADARDVAVQVYPVESKSADRTMEPTDLAEVILFNAEATASSRDYMLVLNRNAYTDSDELWLNVLFEDGTVAEIEIDDDGGYRFDNDSSTYMKAYAYAENSDGTYDVVSGSVINESDARLLRVGTVDQDLVTSYWTLPDNAVVWDVTDMDSASEEPETGRFTFNDVNAVIIPTAVDGSTVRTAFVWEIDDEDTDTSFDTSDYYVELNNINEAIVWYKDGIAAPDLDRCLALIEAELEDQGYTVTDRTRSSNEYTFEVEDRNGFNDTFTFEYHADGDGWNSGWIIESYVGRVNGEEIFVPTNNADISGDLNGSHFYGRLDGISSYGYALVSDATVTDNGFDITDGYTAIDLTGVSFDGETGVADLAISRVTLNGKSVDFGTGSAVQYVKGDGNTVVATVTGSIEVAGTGTGTIGANNAYSSSAAVRDAGDKDQTDAANPEVSGTGRAVNFAAGTSNTTYSDFTLTFTWTVDEGTTTASLVLNTSGLSA